MLVAFATFRVKRGLSLRSKQIFYPSGKCHQEPVQSGSKGGGTTIVDISRSEANPNE